MSEEDQKTTRELLEEWQWHIDQVPALERALSDIKDSSNPCHICCEALEIILGAHGILQESIETISDQIQRGQADPDGMHFMMDMYNQWHSVVLTSVARLGAAGHKELESLGLQNDEGCVAESFVITLGRHQEEDLH